MTSSARLGSGKLKNLPTMPSANLASTTGTKPHRFVQFQIFNQRVFVLFRLHFFLLNFGSIPAPNGKTNYKSHQIGSRAVEPEPEWLIKAPASQKNSAPPTTILLAHRLFNDKVFFHLFSQRNANVSEKVFYKLLIGILKITVYIINIFDAFIELRLFGKVQLYAFCFNYCKHKS